MTAEQVKHAKRAALAQINRNRVAAGFAPLNRVGLLWWRIHGKEWLSKQTAVSLLHRRIT